jgi:hypothetical protein
MAHVMAFIEKLLRDMTLEEKLGQLTMGGGGDAVHSDPVMDARCGHHDEPAARRAGRIRVRG